MKNIILVNFILHFMLVQIAYSQTPSPTIGPWQVNGGNSQTVSSFNAGIDTINPDGKLEVKY